jgi:hypothetical protein
MVSCLFKISKKLHIGSVLHNNVHLGGTILPNERAQYLAELLIIVFLSVLEAYKKG